MKIASIVARIFLGLVFVAAGVAGFVVAPPPQPGFAGQFTTVVYASHFMNFISAAQIVIGILFLINRFVPVALIMLAAFIYNSFAFHATMAPIALFAPILLVVLFVLIALPYRALFAPLFVAKPLPTDRARSEESAPQPNPSSVAPSP